jgi:hypothetical protein
MQAARIDVNQPEIVEGLRKSGASVECLHKVGKGCTDLLVGYRGVNYLIEVKHGKGKLNKRQVRWHDEWYGQCGVAWTIEDALRIIGAI